MRDRERERKRDSEAERGGETVMQREGGRERETESYNALPKTCASVS